MQSVFRLYLLQDHVLDLKILPIVKGEGVDCYKVSAQERGDALVRKQSALEDGTGVRVISQHDLRAIGFKVVEQHLRDSCSPLNDENVCQFYAQLNALADVNSDGEITADELRQTLKNPEFRDRWSKLVVRHHTEWQTQSDGASLQPFRDRLSDDPIAMNSHPRKQQILRGEFMCEGDITNATRSSMRGSGTPQRSVARERRGFRR